MKLNSLLIEHPAMEKLSAVDVPNLKQLESDFANMAFTFITDRAPKLISYLIGFEVVDAAEDGSKAAGIFGFRIGESFYYVPVFFINGQIKGMDSIYSLDSDTFAPLKEAVIEELLASQEGNLGEPGPADARENFTRPDFSIVSQPPQLGVGGRDSNAVKSATVGEIRPLLKKAYAQMNAGVLASLDKDLEFKNMFASMLVKQSSGAVERNSIEQSPMVLYIQKIAGMPAAMAFVKTLQNPEFAKAAATFYDVKELLGALSESKMPAKKAADKITVISKDMHCCTAEEATKVLRQGFAIRDARNADEKTEAFEFEDDMSIYNPNEPGRYKMFFGNGLKEVDVFVPSFGPYSDRMVVVRNIDDGSHITAQARRVMVCGDKVTLEEKDNLFEKAVDVDKVKPGELYLLIDEKMNSSVPLMVRRIVKEDDGVERLVVDFRTCIGYDMSRDGEQGGVFSYGYSTDPYPKTYDIPMFMKDSKGPVRYSDVAVVVPTQTWKFLPLSGDNTLAHEAMRPASYSEVQEGLYKAGAHKLVVDSRDGGLAYNLWFDDMSLPNKTYKQACIGLVQGLGLPVDTAEIMLKEASNNFKSRRLIKFAQVPNEVVMQPPYPQGNQGYDTTIGIPVEYPDVRYMQGDTQTPPPRPSGPGTDVNVGGEATQQAYGSPQGGPKSLEDVGPGMPADAQSLAQMGAQTGQQQVFDQAVIGGMARTYDVSNVIDSMRPEFMKTLDRLGRLLFLFYWKNDDWAERFGYQDMRGLEDLLRSVYKSFGDLVMKLKQKSVSEESPNLM